MIRSRSCSRRVPSIESPSKRVWPFWPNRYEVRYTAGIFERYRYLAGDDSRRLGELDAALSDPAIRAVFCARGGYGTMRLLQKLTARAGSAKPLVGFFRHYRASSVAPEKRPGQHPRAGFDSIGSPD